MKRVHLFEFEDQAFFPDFMRDGGTDFLGFFLQLTNFYEPAASILIKTLDRTASKQLLDLCSGNGGPIAGMIALISHKVDIQFILSDKFPNYSAYSKLKNKFEGNLDYIKEPVDVLEMNTNIKGLRTMFSAIHHFKPDEINIILQQIIKSKQPMAFFDGGDKHIGTILGILLFHPIFFVLFTPFIRPFKWSRIIFTYIIPLIPIFTIWDGVVSIIRLYTPDQLIKMAKAADPQNQYCWESGKVKNKIGFSVSYLVGYPNSRS